MTVGARVGPVGEDFETLFRGSAFASFLDAAPDGILLVHRDGKILRANPSAERMFGYSPGELVTLSVEDLVPERFRTRHPAYRREFDAHPRARPMGAGRELYALRRDGTEFPVEISLSPLESAGGIACAVVSDVTERQRSEARFRAALDAVGDRFFLMESVRDDAGEIVDFVVLDANAAACWAVGRRRESLIGARFSTIPPSAERSAIFETYCDVVTRRQTREHVILIELPGESPRWMRQQLVPVAPDGLVIIAQDITKERTAYETRARLAAIVESSDDAIVGETLEGVVTSWNRAAERIFGYSADEMIGSSLRALDPESGRDDDRHIRELLGRTGQSGHYEAALVRKDGEQIIVNTTATLILDAKGEPVSASKIIRDVTAQKRAQAAQQAAEERLRASERQFASAFEYAPIGLALVSPDGRWIKVNRALSAIIGYTPEELVSRSFADITHPDDLGAYQGNVSKLLAGETQMFEMEQRYLHRDGKIVWVLSSVSLVRDDRGQPMHLICQMLDITERRRMEEEIRENARRTRASLREKEVLLQEVHHRVKNNLQVIASLMNIQLRRLEDRTARNALDQCQARVLAIALIHEKLYQSRDYAAVPFSDYLRGLAANVFHTSGVSASTVQLELHVDPVSLPVDKAIPCGLILNELITNALKHAFPARRRGTVQVALEVRGGHVRLSVSDDGIGMPADFDFQNGKTLGLQLISTLSAQLGASVAIERSPRTTFRVDFDLEEGP